MVEKYSDDPAVLIGLRKHFAARTTEYEGKIKYLTKQIAEEKLKPAFKTSRDERHAKYQEAARRTLMQMQSRLNYFQNMREMFLSELNQVNAVIKGQAPR